MENIQNLQSGKMLEGLLAQTKAKTSDVCWKDLHASSNQTFQFLDLQEKVGNGQNLEQFPAMDGLLHGDCSMLNTGESPQRRQRIALVMDFGGQRAAEILFERTGMSGNSCESVSAWETFARTPETSIAGYDRVVDPAAYTLKIRSGCEGGGKGALAQTELSATISTLQDQTLICLAENLSLHNLKQKF